MERKEMEIKAREKLKGYCKVCKECNGYACAGEVPGMGGIGTASSFKRNVEALKKIGLKIRTIHDAKEPDMSFDFFGEKLEIPILAAPITGSIYNMGGALTEKEFVESMVKGSVSAGTLSMIGDSADLTMYQDGLWALEKVNGKGCGIIKPRSNEQLLKSLKEGEKAGLLALGVDIDGAGLITMALKGQPVGPKTVSELKELVEAVKVPFILKGIMTPDEAELAVEIGAKAIVVSNHGGRVLDYAQATCEALPEIAERVKGKVMILCDGGIRSGVDVYKMLALGADAVLVGRPLIVGAFGGLEEGVELVLKQMKNELYQSMILTGAGNLGEIDRRRVVI